MNLLQSIQVGQSVIFKPEPSLSLKTLYGRLKEQRKHYHRRHPDLRVKIKIQADHLVVTIVNKPPNRTVNIYYILPGQFAQKINKRPLIYPDAVKEVESLKKQANYKFGKFIIK